jgi:hypothetical protein
MIDIDEECKKIEGFEFFSNMGGCGPEDNNYIYIYRKRSEGFRRAF